MRCLLSSADSKTDQTFTANFLCSLVALCPEASTDTLLFASTTVALATSHLSETQEGIIGAFEALYVDLDLVATRAQWVAPTCETAIGRC